MAARIPTIERPPCSSGYSPGIMPRLLWTNATGCEPMASKISAKPSVLATAVSAVRRRLKPNLRALAASLGKAKDATPIVPLSLPQLPPGVVPKGTPMHGLAMDSSGGPFDFGAQQWANGLFGAGCGGCNLAFPGYAYLSELAQVAEYRGPAEVIADEMTRKWIELRGEDGNESHGEKIQKINDAMREFHVQDAFRRVNEQDSFFGRSQIYIAIKGTEGQNSTQRANPLRIDDRGIKQGSLLGFKVIEPIWTTPNVYNSNDPAAPDFYKPTSWYVMGVATDASRLLTFQSREVPDLLKPSYNFGGISLTQLMEPYVKNWLKTRQAVNESIYNYSTTALSTNMEGTLAGDEDDEAGLFDRAELFSRVRSNRGLMLIDKDSEELTQLNQPLSGLSDLQAQAQEHMAAVAHIPLVKLFGTVPAGLNATGEWELKCFYDYIKSQQEANFRAHLKTVIDVLQLHLFGTIDDAITFDFVPLEQMTGKELAEIRKSDADAGTAYINAGVISADEERKRLQHDPESGYDALEGDAPELPDPDANAHATGELEADNAAARGEEAAQTAHERSEEAAAAEAKRNKGKPK